MNVRLAAVAMFLLSGSVAQVQLAEPAPDCSWMSAWPELKPEHCAFFDEPGIYPWGDAVLARGVVPPGFPAPGVRDARDGGPCIWGWPQGNTEVPYQCLVVIDGTCVWTYYATSQRCIPHDQVEREDEERRRASKMDGQPDSMKFSLTEEEAYTPQRVESTIFEAVDSMGGSGWRKDNWNGASVDVGVLDDGSTNPFVDTVGVEDCVSGTTLSSKFHSGYMAAAIAADAPRTKKPLRDAIARDAGVRYEEVIGQYGVSFEDYLCGLDGLVDHDVLLGVSAFGYPDAGPCLGATIGWTCYAAEDAALDWYWSTHDMVMVTAVGNTFAKLESGIMTQEIPDKLCEAASSLCVAAVDDHGKGQPSMDVWRQYGPSEQFGSTQGPVRNGYLKPDLAAPGVEIFIPKSGPCGNRGKCEPGGGSYGHKVWTGTSPAAGLVTSAMAALMDKGLSAGEAKALLMDSAQEPNLGSWDKDLGWGSIHLDRARRSAAWVYTDEADTENERVHVLRFEALADGPDPYAFFSATTWWAAESSGSCDVGGCSLYVPATMKLELRAAQPSSAPCVGSLWGQAPQSGPVQHIASEFVVRAWYDVCVLAIDLPSGLVSQTFYTAMDLIDARGPTPRCGGGPGLALANCVIDSEEEGEFLWDDLSPEANWETLWPQTGHVWDCDEYDEGECPEDYLDEVVGQVCWGAPAQAVGECVADWFDVAAGCPPETAFWDCARMVPWSLVGAPLAVVALAYEKTAEQYEAACGRHLDGAAYQNHTGCAEDWLGAVMENVTRPYRYLCDAYLLEEEYTDVADCAVDRVEAFLEDGGEVARLLCGPQWDSSDCSWLHKDYAKVGMAVGLHTGTCGEEEKLGMVFFAEDWLGTRRFLFTAPNYLMGLSVVDGYVFGVGLAACGGDDVLLLGIPDGSLSITSLDCPTAEFEMTATAQSTYLGSEPFGLVTVHKEGVMVCVEAMP